MTVYDFRRRLNVPAYASDGSEYITVVHGRMRDDGGWEGLLEFSPVTGGMTVRTNVQTTQSNAEGVVRWAVGLSRTHIEDALHAVLHPIERAPSAAAAVPTPTAAEQRHDHVHLVERDVLSMFRAAGETRLPTQEIFARGPHANADFVRAFESLERQRRYLVRQTVGGVDWLVLTADGVQAAGLPVASAGDSDRRLSR